jgi:16S rRNA (uracil1498-N3)-methyltransferase
MPKFFLPNVSEHDVDDLIVIDGADANHIAHSLRMKKGDSVTLTASDRTEYETVIADIRDSSVILRVISVSKNETEPKVFSRLFQALAKGDKMDTVIQKSVELGVGEIFPVSSSRCVVQLDPKRSDKKVERWQRIAEEAAKQCGRGIIPKVHEVISFKEAVHEMKNSDLYFLCYETSRENNPKNLFTQKHFDSVSFFIGPEGGIAPDELDLAHREGIPDITLGKRILRTETAASAVLSMLLYETEF